MSDRYIRLFSLEENLYTPESPVLISAGALLKDTHSGRILGQLKLQSISEQRIKATTVELFPLDTIGNQLGEPISYQYLDLNVSRENCWGSKDAIFFPDSATRAYTVRVKEVVFSDNTIWSSQNVDWKALPKKILLEEELQDSELTKQYRIHFGSDCKYAYQTIEDLWYCPCGAINHHIEETCHKCKKNIGTWSSIDLDLLRKEASERVAKEKADEEAKKIEHQRYIEGQKAIWKKRMRYIIPLCAVVVILLITVAIPKLSICYKQQKLNHAYAVIYDYILENGDWAMANYEIESDNCYHASYDNYLEPFHLSGKLKKTNQPRLCVRHTATLTILIRYNLIYHLNQMI